MNVSSDDAAFIYARACAAWYGRRAPRIVMNRVSELRRRGDLDGVQAWTKVADKLSHLRRKPATLVPTRTESGKLY